MKITKPIIVILFVLLTAQTAFAFYCPETQRWLNRDPIAERGGIDLYEFAGNNPINYFDLLGLSGTLTINTVKGGGSSGLITFALFGTGDTGHSWITYTPDGGATTSYGTFGNNPGGGANGLRENIELSPTYHPTPDASLSTHLSDAQEQNLMDLINQYQQQGQNAWGYTHPCTKFAADAWNAGAGQQFDLGPLKLPSTLGSDIQNFLNAPTLSISTPPTPYYNVNTPTLFLPNTH